MNKIPAKTVLVSILLIVSLISVMLVSACSSSPSSTSSTGSTSTGSTSTGSTSTGSTSSGSTSTGQTYQTMASAGQSTYTSVCTTCHGADGTGSQACPVTIWGSGSELGKYNGATLFTDAQGMLNYISSKMPLSAPGSLTTQQAQEVLAFILLKDNKVSSTTAFDANKLSSISIP